MPISVYIEQSSSATGFKPEYSEIVRKAWVEWREVCPSTISCRFVSDPNQAQVVCKWTDNATELKKILGTACGEAGLGATLLSINSDRIKRAEMTIITVPPRNVFRATIPDKLMRHVALHEVGHALGIIGHSDRSTDIMFSCTFDDEKVRQISARDVNTLLALYKLDQSVMLKHLFKVHQSNTLDPVIKLNNEALEAMKALNFQLAIAKLEEAHKIDPTNQITKQNLGLAYCGRGTKELGTLNFTEASLYFTRGLPFLGSGNKR